MSDHMAEFELKIRDRLCIDETSSSGLRWTQLANQWVRNKQAGTLVQGYWRVRLDVHEKSITCGAHRIVWFLANGRWPEDQIDHVNGNRSDNRLSNLREAFPNENQRNAGKRIDNSSGVKGVNFNKTRGKWCARLKCERGRIQLGYFSDMAAAEKAVMTAREKLHGEFANHGTHRESAR